MNDHDERRVQRLLAQIDEHVAPTPNERARIAQRMWDTANQSTITPPDAADPVADHTEIVRLVSDENLPRSRSLPLRVLTAAAALVIVVSIAFALRTPEEPALVDAADTGTARLELDGLAIEFDSHDTAVLRHTNDLIELEIGTITDARDRGRITLTRAVDPLLASDPAAWFDQQDLRAEPQPHFYNDQLIDSYAVYTTSTSVRRFNCDNVGPCVPILQDSNDLALFIQRGTLNRIDLIDAPDNGARLVVLWFADNNGIVSPNPLLETLRLSDNPTG